MTPKEKAEQLKELFSDSYSVPNSYAKRFAGYCVDEMLDFRNKLYMNEGSLLHEYLLEVKKEIEKL